MRCDFCGEEIEGQPFHKDGMSFCSSECMDAMEGGESLPLDEEVLDDPEEYEAEDYEEEEDVDADDIDDDDIDEDDLDDADEDVDSDYDDEYGESDQYDEGRPY
ncbi:MAG: 50S ribosomal protein L24e [candidate division Zixibacteria bacterium]|nr:50S ribosomal protein L24e [candidate division Zixibacteria bacterium]